MAAPSRKPHCGSLYFADNFSHSDDEEGRQCWTTWYSWSLPDTSASAWESRWCPSQCRGRLTGRRRPPRRTARAEGDLWWDVSIRWMWQQGVSSLYTYSCLLQDFPHCTVFQTFLFINFSFWKSPTSINTFGQCWDQSWEWFTYFERGEPLSRSGSK